MLTRGKSYSAASGLRKCGARLRPLTIPALALVLGGCAGIGIPFGDFNRTGAQTVSTGGRAVPAGLAVAVAVDPSDWEVVRRTIAAVPLDDSGRFDWNNPDTKSSGNVTVLALAESAAAACRPFATTINDARGVRGYRGQACMRADGRWQLDEVSADDTKLL